MSDESNAPAAESGGSYTYVNGERVPYVSPPYGNYATAAPAAKPAGPAPDPATIEPPSRPPNALEQAFEEFGRYRACLLPGAVEQLARQYSSQVSGPPEGRAAAAARIIASKMGQRLINPEYVEPTAENGRPLSPLRTALRRYGDTLAPGVEAQLHDRLAVAMAGLPPDLVAGRLARFLDTAEGLKFRSEAWHARQFRVRPREAAPARDASGQFTTPPPKRRPSSTF